jgi:hypothetical protein
LVPLHLLRVDDAIEDALLRVVEPGAIAAAAEAEAQAASRRDQVREALARDLEAARYGADRAFRQYDAADPENRLVAAELEARWNRALARAAEIEARIAAHDAAAPKLSPLAAIDATMLGTNLRTVWAAPTTDARLKKRIVRTVILEVVAGIDDSASEIVLLIHWIGGVHTELRLPKRRRGQPPVERLDEGAVGRLPGPREVELDAVAVPHRRAKGARPRQREQRFRLIP